LKKFTGLRLSEKKGAGSRTGDAESVTFSSIWVDKRVLKRGSPGESCRTQERGKSIWGESALNVSHKEGGGEKEYNGKEIGAKIIEIRRRRVRSRSVIHYGKTEGHKKKT